MGSFKGRDPFFPRTNTRAPLSRLAAPGRVLAALACAALLSAAPAPAQETSIVPSDWALKPADIRTGEPFRLLAITKKRSLKSWRIEDYNTFVQEEVAGNVGHEAIRAYGESFRVVASSSTVDARDNTGTNPEQALGVPIYWLNGARVADDNADFYDGAWQNHADLRKTNGSMFTANQKLRMIVGTGSNNDGTRHASDVPGADFVRTGDPYDGEVLNDGRILGLNSRERLYALSPVFRAIDAGVPYVAGAAITSDAGADREYATGDEVRVAVTFSEAVTASGSPQLALEIGSETRQAGYRAEESTDTVLVFGYTVTAADHDNDGITITGGGLSGGAITKQAAAAVTASRAFHTVFGQPAHRVHSVPTVVSVDITSTPRSAGDAYGLGEAIEVTVTFSDPLVVDRTGGTPELALRLKSGNRDEQDRTAAYLRTSGSALVFRYVVAAGDAADRIVVRQDTLATGGATIRNALTGRDADLVGNSWTRFPLRVDATLTPPASADATLAALSIDGMTLSPAFDPATREYTAAPQGAATSATVAAAASDSGATVVIAPADADGVTGGHQVSLAADLTRITVELTAADGTTPATYAVTVVAAVSVTAGAATVAEAAAATFTVGRTVPTAATLTVSVDLAYTDPLTGTATEAATLTFAAGAAAATLTAAVRDDRADEPDGAVTATLRAGTDYVVGAPSSATVTVADDDPSPVAALSLEPASIAEDGGTAAVTVTLDRPSSAPTTLTVTVQAVAPARPADFTLSANPVLTVAAGATAGTGTVTLGAVDNDFSAAAKTVSVSATADNVNGITAPAAVALTIADDDAGPEPPTTLTATPRVGGAALAWDAPASGADISGHQYRRRPLDGAYPSTWTDIDGSVPGGPNQAGVTVTGLAHGVTYAFQVRAVNGGGSSEPSNEATVTASGGAGICKRTEQVRAAILDKIAGVDMCAEVTTEHLAAIEGVLTPANTPPIETLAAADFAGLSSLTGLVLHSQELTSLPDGVFDGLSSLTTLNLYNNRIASLPDGAFDGLSSLTTLNLYNNRIASLPDGVFGGLSSLTTLELASNLLTTLPDGVFDGLSSLTWLGLANNGISVLSPATFTGLTGLTKLYIRNNTIGSIPAGLFSGDTPLASLTDLDLSRNSLREIQDERFAGLSNLERLYLTQNSLSEHGVRPQAFRGLSALQHLDLQRNDFRRFHGSQFSGLTSLQTLAVQDNPACCLFEVSLHQLASGRFTARVPVGAPFDLAVPVIVTGGSPVGPVTVPTGATESDAVTAVRPEGSPAAVHVRIGDLPPLPRGHEGYRIQPDYEAYELEVLAGRPVVTLRLVADSIAERDDPATAQVNESSTRVTATVSPPVTAAFSVEVGFEPEAPATAADYSLSTNRTLSFAAGATESAGLVLVVARDNGVDAADKRVAVTGTLSAEGTAAGVTPPAQRTLTIADDDGRPPAPRELVAESAKGGITLSWAAPASRSQVTGHQYRYAAGDATPTAWRPIPASAPGEFNAGGFTVNDVAAGVVYVFEVRAVNGPSQSDPATAAPVTMQATPPEVTIAAGPSPVTEGADATFVLRRTGAAAQALTVTLAVAQRGSFIRTEDGYRPPATAAFAAGAATASVTVRTQADAVDEPDGAVTATVTAAAGAGYAAGAAGAATVIVTDDDSRPVTVPIADAAVAPDWVLTPPGLTAGDSFRLLFLTSTRRHALERSIALYDNHVRSNARAGHLAIRPYAWGFRVLGSTPTTDARDHTDTAGTGGVPIYWLAGPKLAGDYPDLYDGSWDHVDPARDNLGNPISLDSQHDPYTGTDADGVGFRPLGNAAGVTLGALSSGNPITSTTVRSPRLLGRFYALSGLFRVVGEPVPYVIGVTVSSPRRVPSYTTGEPIQVTVTFSAPVDVDTTYGHPRLPLLIGDGTRNAVYSAALSTADTLVYTYTVAATDDDDDGIAFAPNQLFPNLRGANITRQGTGTDADLRHPGLAADPARRVNVAPFRVTSITAPDGHDGQTPFEITIAFSAALGTYRHLEEGLHVAGGEVTGVRQAAQGLVVVWIVTVSPSGGDVAVTLPAPDGCENVAQICSDPDIPLAETAVARIPGPAPVTVAPVAGAVVEGTPAAFTLQRFGSTAHALTVAVKVVGWGSFISRSDGYAAPAEVVFDAGHSSARLTVETEADATDEPDGRIVAEVVAGNGYVVDFQGTAEVAVQDDDGSSVSPPQQDVPYVTGIGVADLAPGAEVHRTGDAIRIGVALSEAVAVTGSPRLAIAVGQATRTAAYDPAGSTPGFLVFTYTVAATDRDADGIAVGADALSLNGGAIHRRNDANVNARLSHAALPQQPAHRVNTATFTATFPGLAATHDGTAFSFTIEFSDDLGDVAHLRQGLQIAGGAVTAVVRAETGQDRRWTITVEPAGRVDVAVTLPAPDGCETDAQICSRYDVALEADAVAHVPGLAGVTIAAGTSPVVEGTPAAFTLTRTGSTDRALTVAVDVAGWGSFIGRSDGYAAPTDVVFAAGSSSAVLTVETDADGTDEPDGRIVAAIAAGDGYTVETPGAAEVTVRDDDGSSVSPPQQDVPYVTGISVAGLAAGAQTHRTGDVIRIGVGFSEAVAVTGAPQLAVAVGQATPAAAYDAARSTPGFLVFTYTVAAADRDDDGIAVGADALSLNGGAIHRRNDAAVSARLSHAALPRQPAHRVNAFTAKFVGLAASHDGTAFSFTIEFSQGLDTVWHLRQGMQVTGGDATTIARAEADRNTRWTVTVQPAGNGDVTVTLPAPDGCTTSAQICSIGDRPLAETLTRSVRGSGSPPARLASLALDGVPLDPVFDPETTAYAATAVHGMTTVTITATPAYGDGSVTIIPADAAGAAGHQVALDAPATTVTVTVTAQGGAGRDYTVTIALPEVAITAGSGPVVEGTPATFTLTRTGSTARALTVAVEVAGWGSFISRSHGYAAPTDVVFAEGSSSAVLTVQTEADGTDEPDGRIVAAIVAGDGYVVATPGVAEVTVRDDDGGSVSPPQEDVPYITGVSIADGAQIHRTGDAIRIGVAFSEAVEVTGAPRLAVAVGRATRTAVYDPAGSAAGFLVFTYTVVAADWDGDGIAVGADALSLNGGAIHRRDDAAVSARLSHAALPHQPAHRVNAFIAEFIGVEASHDGTAFSFTVAFSDDLGTDAHLQQGMQVTGGEATGIARAEPVQNTHWTVTVQPAGSADVTVTLPAPNGCTTTAQICTISGHPLAEPVTARVRGPGSLPARLASLAIDGPPLDPVFDPETTAYAATSAPGATAVTVTATPAYRDASVTITPADAAGAAGHQVALGALATTVTVTVTAQDGTSRDYTVTVASPAEVTVAAGASPVVEGTPATFTLTRTGFTARPLTVAVEIADPGSFIDRAGVSPPPTEVVFGPNAATAPLTLDTEADAVYESDGVITVTVTPAASGHYTVGSPSAATVAVTDDDASQVTLRLEPPAISEAGGVSVVSATVARPVGSPFTVTVSAAPVAPATTNDYTLSANRVLTFSSSGTESTGRVTVTAVDNTVDAAHKTVIVSGVVAPGVEATPATLRIGDDEDLLTAWFVDGSPDTHAGPSSTFQLWFDFSDPIRDGFVSITGAWQITGGEITKMKRREENRAKWRMTVRPYSNGDVVAVLSPGSGPCGTPPTLCAAGVDEPLWTRLEHRLDGPANAPDAPRNLTASPGVGEVRLQWDRPASDGGLAIDRYQYRQLASVRRGAWTDIPDSGAGKANETAYVVSALRAGIAYTFQVRAVNLEGDTGESEPSREASASPLAAAGPADFTLSASPAAIDEAYGGAAVVTVSTAVFTAADRTITLSFAGTATRNDDYTVAADTLTLPAGARSVTTTVTAVSDTVTDDDETVVVSARIGTDSVGTPQTITISEQKTLTARFVDGSPTTHTGEGNRVIVRYDFNQDVRTGYGAMPGAWTVTGGTIEKTQRHDEQKDQWELWLFPGSKGDMVIVLPAATGTCTESGLPVCADGADELLQTRLERRLDGPAYTPGPPTGLAAYPASGAVELSWNPPADYGRMFIHKHQYRMAVGSGGPGAWTDIPDSGVRGAYYRSHRVTGLDGGLLHTFEVRAVNREGDAGHGPASEPAGAFPWNPGDPLPWTVSVNPASIAEAAGVATVTVSRDSADVRDDRIITLTFAGTAVRDADYSVPAATLTVAAGAATVTGQVTAIDDFIDDDDVTVIVGARLGNVSFGQPRTITITDDDTRGVVVTPTELAIDAGRTGAYTVALQSRPTDTVTVTPSSTGDVTAAALTFAAADWRTAQTVTVTADQDAGDQVATVTHAVAGGDYAAAAAAAVTVTVTARSTVPTPPAAPTGLTAEPGEERVTLSWHAPAEDEGAAITGYQYRSSADAGATWTDWTAVADGNDPGSDTGDETGVVVAGLDNAARVFEVRAVNGVGAGTAVRSATTAALLAAPRGLRADARDGSVELTWHFPAAGITGHQYRYWTAQGHRPWTAIPDSGRNGVHVFGFTVAELPNGVPHRFELRAVNAAGASGPSPSVTATPGQYVGICGRTPAVHEAVVSILNADEDAGNDVSGCAGVTDEHLGSILALDLGNGGIASLRAGDFQGMWQLGRLSLRGNLLSTLPPRLFSGRQFTALDLRDNPGSPFPVTVGLKRDSGAFFEATAPAGAPFELVLPVTVANGSLFGGATTVTLRAGAVESAGGFLVERTSGTTGAVTVTIGDLPALPANHQGYTLTRSADLPLRLIAPDGAPDAPTGLRAEAGNAQATLAWNAPATSSSISRHEYRYRTTGAYGGWTRIADSAPDGANAAGVTVSNLKNGVTHRFQVRAVNASNASDPSESAAAFPGAGLGICDRTPQVRDAILDRIEGVTDCAQAAVGHLAAIAGTLDVAGEDLQELRAGDLAGLPRVSAVDLQDNQLAALPSRAFAALSSLTRLDLRNNRLSILPADLFAGLDSLTHLRLTGNAKTLGVTVVPEPAGAAGFKAVAPTGAPFELVLPVTVANGAIDGGAAAITIPAGALESTDALTVTRPAGASEAVTVAIGTPPGLPSNHDGYELVRAALPLEVLAAIPAAPANLRVSAAAGAASLRWDPPAAGADVARHEFRYRADADPGYPHAWTPIPRSAPGGDHEGGHDVSDLAVGTPYHFQVRAVNGAGAAGLTAQAPPVTPFSGPRLTLTLAPERIAERDDAGTTGRNEAVAAVTATLDRAAGTAFTVTVSVAPVEPAVAGDYTLSTNDVLSFAADETVSTGTVTIAAVDNDVNAPARMLTVSAAVSDPSVTAPASVTLTIANDERPAAPTGLAAVASDRAVTLSWDEPAAGVDVTGHQYRYQTDGDYPETWSPIPDSAPGEENAAGHVVEGLSNDVGHRFEVRAVNEAGGGAAAESPAVTPTLTVVTVRAGAEPVTEGGDAAFALSRTGLAAEPLTVAVTVAETGAMLDGTPPAAVTFGAGAGTTTLTLGTLADAADEADSVITVTVTAAEDAAYGVGEDGSATVTVADDDSGFCDRTPVVRDAIVAAAAGADACGEVTAAHLAAIDGTLALGGGQIAALQAGDFAGLTALTGLDLSDNGLTTLPAGVFAGLTALTRLELQDNQLTLSGQHRLPDGLLEDLTALAFLDLSANAAASFAPSADAGTDLAATAGDTATLDGTGSDGGIWGGNVTYTWTQTGASDGTVELAEPLTATPSFTVPQPDGGGGLEFELTVTGRGAGKDDHAYAAADRVQVTVLARQVTVTADAAPVVERAGAAFALARTGGTASELSVAVSVTETGAMIDGTAPESVVFPAGEAGVTLTVATEDDATDEPDSEVRVTLTEPPDAGYQVGEAGVATVTVTDDELPAITALAFDGEAPAGGHYTIGGVIGVAALYGEAVAVTGAPELALAVGDQARAAVYHGGAGTRTVTFRYTVASGDADGDGVSVAAGSVTLPPGAAISRQGESAVAAGLAHPAVAADAARKVDGVRPEVSSATVTEAALVLAWTEKLDPAKPATSAFAVTVQDAARTVDAVAVVDAEVRLTLTSPVLARETVTVAYTRPAGAGAALLRDVAGNAADSFGAAEHTVVNETEPPPQVVLALDRATITESDDTGTASDNEAQAVVTATVTRAVDAAFTVTVTAVAAAPATPDDFTLSTDNVLSFAADETAGTGTVTVTAVDDDVNAVAGTVTLAGSVSAAGATAGVAPPEDVTLTIANDELPAAPENVQALAGSGRVALSWEAPAAGADVDHHRYRYKTDGDYPETWTAIPDSAPGEANAAGYVVEDLDNDVGYTFQVQAVNANGASAARTGPRRQTQQATLPVVGVVSADSVTEGYPAVFRLSRAGVTTSALTVTVAVTSEGTVLKTADGYRAPDRAVFVARAATVEVPVQTEHDQVDEPDGSITLTVVGGADAPYTVSAAQGTATVTVIDDDYARTNPTLTPTAGVPTPKTPSAGIYRVTFTGLWTTASTPGGVPAGAHFSPPIGAVHDSGARFLAEGGTATAGVESMAEAGGTAALKGEIAAAGTAARAAVEGSGTVLPTATTTLEDVRFTTRHPRVTLLSRIAPSPDWFVGVAGLSLLNTNGWVETLTVDLYPWDAGTEDGYRLEDTNAATVPRGTVTNLRGQFRFTDQPMARLTFTRQSVVTPPATPANLAAAGGNARTALSWDAPASDAAIDGHRYRYRADTAADWPEQWTAIPDSGPGEANAGGYTVTGLTNGVTYRFQVRTVNAVGASDPAEATAFVKPRIVQGFQRHRNDNLEQLDDLAPIRVRGVVRIVFNVDPAGFGQDDVEVTNGTVTRFELRGTRVLDLAVAVNAGATEVTVGVREDAVTSEGGNAAQQATYATLPRPAVVLSTDATEPVTGPFDVVFAFNAPVVLEGSDVENLIGGFLPNADVVAENASSPFEPPTTSALVERVEVTYRPLDDFEGYLSVHVPANAFVAADELTVLNAASDRLSLRVDTREPTLMAAAVKDATLTTTWSERLDAMHTGAGGFAVAVAGQPRTVTGVAVDGRVVRLTLASAVTANQSVQLGYAKPSSEALRDRAGNEAESFSARDVVQRDVTVRFAAGYRALAEGESAELTVRLSGAPGEEITIPVAVTGAGGVTLRQDLTIDRYRLTFSAEATTRTLTVTAADDADNDDGESVIVEFGPLPAGVSAGSPSTVEVPILDDDGTEVAVRFGQAAWAVPDGRSVTGTVVLDAPLAAEAVIPLTATPGPDTGAVDFTAPAQVTIAAGATEAAFTVTSSLPGAAAGRSVTLGFGPLPAALTAGRPTRAVVSVVTMPEVMLRLDREVIAENAGVATVTASVPFWVRTPFTVEVAVKAVAPAAAGNFALSTNNVLSFAARATESTGAVTITAVDDDADTVDKQVTVSATVADPAAATPRTP